MGENPVHPSIDVKGMTTIRLQRLHFSSKPWPRTLAMSWPHSQRVSCAWYMGGADDLVVIIDVNSGRDEIENNY